MKSISSHQDRQLEPGLDIDYAVNFVALTTERIGKFIEGFDAEDREVWIERLERAFSAVKKLKVAPVRWQRVLTTRSEWAEVIRAELRRRDIAFDVDDDGPKSFDGLPVFETEAQISHQEMREVVQCALLQAFNTDYGLTATGFDDPLAFAALMEFRDKLGYLQKWMQPFSCLTSVNKTEVNA